MRRLLSTLALGSCLVQPATASVQAPRLQFERTIGCELCDGPERFREVQSVFVEGDRVVVTDGDEPHVRVFPLEGDTANGIRLLGNEGDGPGELRTPLTAVLHVDGALTVVDLQQKRITGFDEAGDVTTTRPFNAFPAGAGYARDVDRLLLTVTDFQGGLALVRPRGGPGLDTLLAEVPFQDGEGMRFISPAVRDDGAFAFGEGSTEYAVQIYAPDGTLLRTLRRDVERRPRTRQEIEALRERMVLGGGPVRRRAEGGGDVAPEVDRRQPHFSPLSALQFDDLGRLWIRSSRAPAGRTLFDVFAADFTYLGEVEVDGRIGVYSVRDGWLAGATKDELDVAGVGIWRVIDG